MFNNNGAASPLMSPGSARLNRGVSLNSNRDNRQNQIDDLVNNQFDRDQFMRICTRIKDILSITSRCSPEVIAQSQVVCGLNFELVQNA